MVVLYLNAGDHELDYPRKLAGIRRFARSRGWHVETFLRRDVPASAVPGLLRRFRPAGCVIEDSDPRQRLPSGAFRSLPIVWLDPPDPEKRKSRPFVTCDQESVAEAAFRELSPSTPPCFAVVPSPSLVAWNRRRIAAFAALCEKADKPCHVFPGRAEEEVPSRTGRLSAWLAGLPAHTAIFAANDFTAKGVVEAAATLHLRCPRDFTLVGADAIPETLADATSPGISSIELDFELAGYLAAKLLDAEISRSGAGTRQASFGPVLTLRKESTRGHGRREPIILRAVETIRREACDGLTAASLAARLPGSRKHFERRFREAMGHSVLDEILHVRFQSVFDLLSRPKPAINAVAGFCGFTSDRELRKLFRSRHGMSMRQWRNLHLR